MCKLENVLPGGTLTCLHIYIPHYCREPLFGALHYACTIQRLQLQCSVFLNQARAWFLEIAFVREVGVCVCICVSVCPRGH